MTISCEKRWRAARRGAPRDQVSSLFAISGANVVAVAVMAAQAISSSETGQVAPPLQAIREAAISGVNPPLMAAPT